MKTITHLTLAQLTLAMVLACFSSASLADHSADRTRFEGFIHFCRPGETLYEDRTDGILTFRAKNLDNRWMTGNYLLDGLEDNIASGRIDTNTGEGVVKLKMHLKPDAVAGSWLMWQKLTIAGPDTSGQGFGFGTGDLRGKIVWFSTGGMVMVPESPCGGPSVPVQGRIVGFGWLN